MWIDSLCEALENCFDKYDYAQKLCNYIYKGLSDINKNQDQVKYEINFKTPKHVIALLQLIQQDPHNNMWDTSRRIWLSSTIYDGITDDEATYFKNRLPHRPLVTFLETLRTNTWLFSVLTVRKIAILYIRRTIEWNHC